MCSHPVNQNPLPVNRKFRTSPSKPAAPTRKAQHTAPDTASSPATEKATIDARARTKASLRKELEQAMQQFLHSGGEVNNVPSGTSAWQPGTRPPPSNPLFTEPRAERTPLNDVVATLEARREEQRGRRKPASKTRRTRRRRQTIYDDFGEPLRHIWIDD